MAKQKTNRQTKTIEVEIVDVSELKPDPDNANRGTERGDYMLSRSLEKFGAARSIVVDRNLVIPAGNKTHSKFGEIGGERVMIIPSDGKTLIAVKREDWDLLTDDPDNPAREYAFGDNIIAFRNLNLDGEKIISAIDAGIDLGDLWFDDELAEIRSALGETGDEWIDDFNDPAINAVMYRVIVDELTRDEADELAERIGGRVEQYRVSE